MLNYPYKIDGEPVTVRVVETPGELNRFWDWFDKLPEGSPIGIDSETTGLDTYSESNYLRTVQFGTRDEAWVIPVEKSRAFKEAVNNALVNSEQALVLHNASFDLQVFERHLGISMEKLWPRVVDTRILAHLVDPRGQEEGGTGHGLEALTAAHVDAVVAEEIKASMGVLAKELKVTKAKLWALPELIDHPKFHLYAGIDPILAVRLMEKLNRLVPFRSNRLVSFEHSLAAVFAEMEGNGFLLDEVYTEDLSAKFEDEEADASWHAENFFGIESVNSTEQVADALEDLGIKIPERTPTGKRKVDSKLLESLMPKDDSGKFRGDLAGVGSAEHLASAVYNAKKARKWRTTWVDGFLDGADRDSRVHPSINPLRARTARMSITGIPAQTLPAGDWVVRRCFVAEEGHRIVSVDYKAQELRVLAALANVPAMREVFQGDGEIHLATARSLFGPDVQKGTKEYKIGKMTNFLTVYGGGAKALAVQAGIDVATAKKALAAFDRAYPEVARYADKLAKEAKRNGYIYTPTGRRLPVDPDRAYSALNYMIQSTSRDITCRGILRLHESGWTPYLRLPVHDEVVASLPADKAEWGAKEIARLMRMEFMGVDIDTDPEVGGRSWGSLYGSDY